MSTLADELLNDFEDSGSEGEGDQQNGFLQDQPTTATNGSKGHQNVSTEMDIDEEEEGDEDEEMLNGDTVQLNALEDANGEEEAKAKVEKMQLGGVNDVRSVAGLMKTLEPVLEVCHPSLLLLCYFLKFKVYICFVDIALTSCVACRKSHTISRYHQGNKTLMSAPSKTTLNIIFSLNLIHSQPQ